MTDQEIEEREKALMNHPLVLGRCSKNSDEGEGYTIFKNTNEEMVKKIKAVTVPQDTWIEKDGFMTGGAKGVSRVEKKLNDTQFLCVDEHGHYFIKKADTFEESSNTDLLQKINEEFDAAEILTESLGELYTDNGYGVVKFMGFKEYLKEKWDDYADNKKKIEDMHRPYGSMGRIYSTEIGAYLDTYGGIILSEGEIGGSSMFCHINKDGNVVNRDYNYDIKWPLQSKKKTREDLIQEILDEIPEGKYEHYGNKWFGDKFCFVMQQVEEGEENDRKGVILFNLTKIDHQGNGRYKNWRSGSVKKPKSAKPSSRDHLLAEILPFVNKLEFGKEEGDVDLTKYINYSNLEVKQEAPKKRVQKTKIKEKGYDVRDWSSKETAKWLFTDDYEDLTKALEEFSNGINVGHNEDLIKDWTIEMLEDGDLPSFSFNKGEKQPNHSKFKGLVKYPFGINCTYKVDEGDAVEITWAHSIYRTDVVDFEIVE